MSIDKLTDRPLGLLQRVALLTALSSCADRTISDGTEGGEGTTSTTAIITTGPETSSSTGVNTGSSTASGVEQTGTGEAGSSGTGADICADVDKNDLPGDPECQEELSPEEGFYALCDPDFPVQCDEVGGVCFPFTSGNTLDYSFCSVPCETDFDCLIDCPWCGASPTCTHGWINPDTQMEIGLCVLGCEFDGTYQCPGGESDPTPMICLPVTGLYDEA